MKRVLIIGAGGMLGYLTYHVLNNLNYSVTGVTKTRKRGRLICLDATIESNLEGLLLDIKPEIIINCAALLTGSSEERKSDAIKINTWLPHYLLEYCNKYDTYLIQVSTDGVFSGKTGGYKEDAPSDADTFYGRSKYLGEVYGENALTVRSAFWGIDVDPRGNGLFQWFMRQRGQVGGYNKAFFNGVSNLEFTRFVESAIRNRWTGVYHLCAKDTLSKYEFLVMQKKVFQIDAEIIPSESVCMDRSLICTRTDIPYVSKSFEEMMVELRKWKTKMDKLF